LVTPTPLADVEVVSPAPHAAWQRALAADPTAFPTQTPEWLAALRAARGHEDASRLYMLPDGRELVLPMSGRRWAGLRVAKESWPYGWGYGGLLVPGGKVSSQDIALVLSDLVRHSACRTSIVPMPLAAPAWSAAVRLGVHRIPYLTHIVSLDAGFPAVFAGYHRSTRNLVRKVSRSSLDVRRECGGDIVQTFADMYNRAVERWAQQRGLPLALARLSARYQDRAGQVKAVSASLGQSCVFWSAWRDAEPVAVLVVLQHGAHALSWLTAIDRRLADDTGGTYLLQSLAIEDACRVGARYFHLGETDAGSGVELYKTKFGAAPVAYQALRLERLPVTEWERRIRGAGSAAFKRRAGHRQIAEVPSDR